LIVQVLDTSSIPRRIASPAWLKPYLPVCEALTALLGPHGEVVVHDLAADRIIAIWNPMSGRAVGDESLISELPEMPDRSLAIGPYGKVLADGREITSVSAVLVDAAGERRGLLCVNVDRSPLDQIAALASSLIAAQVDRPPELFERDWREQIPLRVRELRQARAARGEELDRAGRREIVARLDGEGLFAVRRAADLAAEALGISRATLYSLLKEVRS
jgi:D-arginine utilization repressor